MKIDFFSLKSILYSLSSMEDIQTLDLLVYTSPEVPENIKDKWWALVVDAKKKKKEQEDLAVSNM